MGIDYRLFPNIQSGDAEYSVDVRQKVCPLVWLWNDLKSKTEKAFLWLEAGASMGKSTSTVLLEQTLIETNNSCYRFPLKQLNYDQTSGADGTQKHFIECIETISMLPENATVILDGYDEVRKDLWTIGNANKCISVALDRCSVIVVSRLINDKPTFDGYRPFVARILPLSKERIIKYLQNDSRVTGDKEEPLFANVLFLKIYHDLMMSNAKFDDDKHLTEAFLLEQYFVHEYSSKGKSDETVEGRIHLYNQNITEIGRAIYCDIKASENYFYSAEDESQSYELEQAYIPHPLNGIYTYTDHGGIDSDQIIYLNFAVAKYLVSEIRAIIKKSHNSFKREQEIKKLTEEIGTDSANYAYVLAGELLSEQTTDFNGKEIIDLLSKSENLYSNSNATFLCLGYNSKVFDDRYGAEWGNNSLKWFKDHYDEPDLADRISVEAYLRLKSLTGTYTGETLDGEMHGHGIYRWSDEIWYEGEFVHGKRNGIGTMHYPDGHYYGQWCDGLENGKGRYAYKNGDVYEGRFVNGSIEGEGTYWWSDNGAVYIGEWKNNLRHGHGVMQYSSEEWYDGEWCEGFEHGIGRRRYENGDIYIGEWKLGSCTGKGKYISSEYTYEGNFLNFLMHGYGKKILPNGDVYEGEFVDDQACGKGRYICADDGSWFYGDWENNVRVYGEMHFSDNDFAQYHVGEYRDGRINGKGVLYDHERKIYDGEFVDGKAQGRGTYYYDDGAYYQGDFFNNKFHGYGILYDSDGTITEGEWKCGELIDT